MSIQHRLLLGMLLAPALHAQIPVNALWKEPKIRNFLPHMTSPEVRALLSRTDIVIIPVPALEQHADHLPIGTDYFAGVEQAKLIAQRTDALVAPILLAGQSPYHMEFAGTISLPSPLLQQVYFEAAKSLIRHGFRRLLFLNSHVGNQYLTRAVVDRINQETVGTALELRDAVATMEPPPAPAGSQGQEFDRHAGVGETALGLYLFPSLVKLEEARIPTLTLPPHLAAMLPLVAAGDRAATLIFLAEGLKPSKTGKGTSARQMSSTGAWSVRDPHLATSLLGEQRVTQFVDAAVRFIERWRQLTPRARP